MWDACINKGRPGAIIPKLMIGSSLAFGLKMATRDKHPCAILLDVGDKVKVRDQHPTVLLG
jgi:hypothetical protein